jgi:ParB family chromosome partitioning protein
MSDEQKTERRRVITNNKAWDVATPVRRDYLIELLSRRSVPKGTLRYVTSVIMADPAGLAAGDGDRVASLIGKETHPGAWDRTAAMALASDASDGRLPLVLLAQVAASVEARFGERQGWRYPNAALRAYLGFLAACGYGLSEVEQEVTDTGDDSEDEKSSA